MSSSIEILNTNSRALNLLRRKIYTLWSLIGLEALIWVTGLIYLIFINSPEQSHFTICPIANLGFEFCLGCGLGNSISYLFNGDFVSSFHSHPLGIFAVIVISIRIFSLIKINRRRYA